MTPSFSIPPTHPDGVTVFVGSPRLVHFLAELVASIETKPVEVLSVAETPHEVGTPWVLDSSGPWRVGHPICLPGFAIVATVSMASVT